MVKDRRFLGGVGVGSVDAGGESEEQVLSAFLGFWGVFEDDVTSLPLIGME